MAPNDPFFNVRAADISQQSPPTFNGSNTNAQSESSASKASQRGLWATIKTLFGTPKRQAAISAIFYGISGISEFAEINDRMGVPENTPMDALFVTALVGIPTALMLKRNGYVSAGLLCGIAIMNAVSCYAEMQAGNPYYNGGSVVYNLFFLGIFAHAAWHLWKTRKEKA